MSIRLADRGIRVVLLDIEGTTTPIAFVHEVLFSFARAHLAEAWDKLRGSSDAREIAAALAAEHDVDVRWGQRPAPWSMPPDDVEVLDYLRWLMDRDRKSPALKRLQGLIWEVGYQAGQLRGEVYPDVPGALKRWNRRGLSTAIYSSGSELAQRRLFSSTAYGDLTAAIVRYFDTAVGAKQDVESYRRIASALDVAPGAMIFVSDVDAELVAAREAGCQTLLSARPANPPQPRASEFQSIRTLDELE